MKELISDPVYEQSMEVRLDQTKELLQSMLDAFHALDLQVCDSSSQLYDLAFHPKEIVDEGQYQKESDTGGLNQVQKENYLAKLQFRNPNAFYIIARKAQQDPYAEKGQALWTIKGGKVQLNRKNAHEILKQKSVYVNERQEPAAKDLLKLHELYNKVNKASYGALSQHFNNLFDEPLREGQEDAPRSLNTEVLKQILQAV